MLYLTLLVLENCPLPNLQVTKFTILLYMYNISFRGVGIGCNYFSLSVLKACLPLTPTPTFQYSSKASPPTFQCSPESSPHFSVHFKRSPFLLSGPSLKLVPHFPIHSYVSRYYYTDLCFLSFYYILCICFVLAIYHCLS